MAPTPALCKALALVSTLTRTRSCSVCANARQRCIYGKGEPACRRCKRSRGHVCDGAPNRHEVDDGVRDVRGLRAWSWAGVGESYAAPAAPAITFSTFVSAAPSSADSAPARTFVSTFVSAPGSAALAPARTFVSAPGSSPSSAAPAAAFAASSLLQPMRLSGLFHGAAPNTGGATPPPSAPPSPPHGDCDDCENCENCEDCRDCKDSERRSFSGFATGCFSGVAPCGSGGFAPPRAPGSFPFPPFPPSAPPSAPHGDDDAGGDDLDAAGAESNAPRPMDMDHSPFAPALFPPSAPPSPPHCEGASEDEEDESNAQSPMAVEHSLALSFPPSFPPSAPPSPPHEEDEEDEQDDEKPSPMATDPFGNLGGEAGDAFADMSSDARRFAGAAAPGAATCWGSGAKTTTIHYTTLLYYTI